MLHRSCPEIRQDVPYSFNGLGFEPPRDPPASHAGCRINELWAEDRHEKFRGICLAVTRQRAELHQHACRCEIPNDLPAYFACNTVDRIIDSFSMCDLLQSTPKIFVLRTDDLIASQSVNDLGLCASVNHIDGAKSVNLGKLQNQSAHAGRRRCLQEPFSLPELLDGLC